MLRRDFLRVMVPATLAPRLLLGQQAPAGPPPPPPAPVPWTLGLNPATPLPQTVVADEIGTTELRFFSATQTATLRRLAGTLMPPLGSKPGAIEARAPEFLDFLIGSSPAPRKAVYQNGLDWMEAQAQTRYGRTFATLDETQAGALIQPWLRTWMSDHPPQEPHADFVNIAHTDIRTATVNSKEWNDAMEHEAGEKEPMQLFWQPIEPDMAGDRAVCARMPRTTTAAPKSEHSVPAYPR